MTKEQLRLRFLRTGRSMLVSGFDGEKYVGSWRIQSMKYFALLPSHLTFKVN